VRSEILLLLPERRNRLGRSCVDLWGLVFCPERPTMQARESKRARESVLACCRRLLSAGRQTVRGSLLALVNSICARRNYSVLPQYANARPEVPSTCCLDVGRRFWLAIRAVPRTDPTVPQDVVRFPTKRLRCIHTSPRAPCGVTQAENEGGVPFVHGVHRDYGVRPGWNSGTPNCQSKKLYSSASLS
jgi:hypothetical protein